MIGAAIGSIGTASQNTAKPFRYPAPMKGIDQRNSLAEGDLNTCIYSYNICPFEYGMKVRKGYEEWQIGAETAPDLGAGIHTIIPYDSQTTDTINDRLFVVTNEGIWDATVQGDAPVLMAIFTDQAEEAGYGVYTHYVTSAATDLLYYADSLNGLFQFDPVLNTWVQSPPFTYTAGTPPAIEDIKFVISHKQRLWFVEENTATAWYLEINSITGEVAPFYFGSKFKHGGTLEGLFSWTVDGGAGVDDILVAVSRSGDVLPYKGDNPADATAWDLVGTYFIGEVPRGPFFGTEHGGELFLLSVYGIIGMNDLLQGVDSKSIQSNTEGSSVSLKISAYLRRDLQKTIGQYGWCIKLIPSEGGVLISSPTQVSTAPIQYYYNVAADGWAFWRDVPMTAFDTWQGEVVFGDKNNRVLRMGIAVDNELLTPIPDEENGQDIVFSILTSFSALETPATYKKIKLIRPDFIAVLAPVYSNQARYDYDIGEAELISRQPQDNKPPALWDTDKWDAAFWTSDNRKAFSKLGGSWGYGRYVSIATKGKTRSTTRLIGWDIIYTVGGPLL